MGAIPWQGVLLDLDGTLIDGFTPIVIALNRTLAKYGLPTMASSDIRRHTGIGDGSLATLFGDRWPQAKADFLQAHDRIHLETIAPLPGAEELLAWLRQRGIPTGIVTNKAQGRAEEQIRHLGWDRWIDAIVGACDEHPAKPHPHPVRRLCRRLGFAAEHALLIGDGPADMQAANAAGCTGIGLTGAFSAAELVAAGARRCFHDLREVLAWLRAA